MYLVVKKLKKTKWSLRLRDERKRERYVKKGPVLIVRGGKGTGKTRELRKMAKWARGLWGVEGFYFLAPEGISNWLYRVGLKAKDLRGMNQIEKLEKIYERLKDKAVIIDDIDKIQSTQKKDIIKTLIRNAKIVVVSCYDTEKIDPSIITELQKKLRNLKKRAQIEEYCINLGRTEEEIKEIGIILGVVLVIGVALIWGFTEALLGAVVFRWLIYEKKQK